MERIKKCYALNFNDRNFIFSLFGGLLLLAASLVLQFFANAYTIKRASDSVTDVILSNTRVYDVGIIFTYGSVFVFFLCLYVCISKINYVPFVTKSIALFTIIRSLFISLTHISPYPLRATINSAFFRHDLFSGIFTGDGLFFSGHTGLPFLLALIFWENKPLRLIFLACSVTFGVIVLLGHLHYSIDVFSAFFITFSIFHICKFLFKKDWELFLQK